MAYLEQRFIGGRGCWYLNGVELLLEFGPVVVYVRHCDHDAGRRGERRPSVVPDRHLKTKIKFLRIGWKLIFCHCESFLTVFTDTKFLRWILLWRFIDRGKDRGEFSFENFCTRKMR